MVQMVSSTTLAPRSTDVDGGFGVEQRGAADQLRDVLAEPIGLEDLDVRPERQYLNRRAFEGVEAERRLEPPMPVRWHVTFHPEGLEASEQRSRPPALG